MDNICVPKEFFVDTFCILHILPIDFHITRVSNKTSIAQLKRMFHCGSELAMGVKKAVAERRQIPLKRSGKKPMRNDPSLIRLVDQTTSRNGHVSDTELASILVQAGQQSTTSAMTSSETTSRSATGRFCRSGRSRRDSRSAVTTLIETVRLSCSPTSRESQRLPTRR